MEQNQVEEYIYNRKYNAEHTHTHTHARGVGSNSNSNNNNSDSNTRTRVSAHLAPHRCYAALL